MRDFKRIKGIVHRTLNEFDKSEEYIRGLAFNQTEFKIEVVDNDLLEDFGLLRTEIKCSTQDDNTWTQLGEFYLLSVDYYVTTKFIEVGVDSCFFNFHGVHTKIHVIEVEEKHKNSKDIKLILFDDIEKYSFETDMHEINLRLSVALNMSKLTVPDIKRLYDIGVAKSELMLVYKWDMNSHNHYFAILKYIYENYNRTPVKLFVVLNSNYSELDMGLFLRVLKKLIISVDNIKKNIPKIEVEIETPRNMYIPQWIYKGEVVKVLSEFYRYYDNLVISSDNLMFLQKSL